VGTAKSLKRIKKSHLLQGGCEPQKPGGKTTKERRLKACKDACFDALGGKSRPVKLPPARKANSQAPAQKRRGKKEPGPDSNQARREGEEGGKHHITFTGSLKEERTTAGQTLSEIQGGKRGPKGSVIEKRTGGGTSTKQTMKKGEHKEKRPT